MNVRFAKWGNSLAVRIPASFAEEIAAHEGGTADLAIENGCLVIRPLAAPVFDLDALIAGIRPDNLHEEVRAHGAVGNEFG